MWKQVPGDVFSCKKTGNQAPSETITTSIYKRYTISQKTNLQCCGSETKGSDTISDPDPARS
jgi:hypothetical protein